LQVDGSYATFQLQDYAYHMWRKKVDHETALPRVFVASRDLSAEAHLGMQAALQPYVDNAISKTINVPTQLPFDQFSSIYQMAYDSGCKGCTTFRPNPITGSVLRGSAAGVATAGEHAPFCCSPEREAD
jgi:ribonucleoside-diphosphate reductase alpha chain